MAASRVLLVSFACFALFACGPKEDTAGEDTAGEDTASAPTDADSDGYTADVDRDDTDATVHPGGIEVCDGIDNDCDGGTDESDAADAPTWYRDADADGFGDAGASLSACAAPSGYVADTIARLVAATKGFDASA